MLDRPHQCIQMAVQENETMPSPTDEDGDTLTFPLPGADSGKFSIDPNSGASPSPPDRTTKSQPMQIVTMCMRLRYLPATPYFTTSKTVQVTITNVVEAPTNILLSATEIEENQPAGTVVGDLALVDPESADNLDDDEYRIVVLNTSTNQISEVNQDTGALTPLMTVSFNVGQAHGFDRNPADGKLYLSRIPADNTLEFYEIDLDAQSATLVKSFSTNFSRYNFSSMGFTNEGDVYLYQEVSAFSVGSLHFVDWDAGTVSRKGSTNTPSILGGDYDAQRNVFWATDEWDGKLYQVNPDTSAITWTSTSTWNYGNGPNIGDVGVTPDGQVLVAVDDYGSSKILKVDPDAKNWTVLYTLSQDAEMHCIGGKKATGRLELVAGAADNQHFQISGDQLLTNQEFDFEEKNEYSVTIRGWNEHNLSIDRTFALSITDIYEKPNPNIFVESAADMEMIWVEPGTYAMGPAAWDGNRQVTITNGFYLGKYEVTQAQYEAVMTGNTNGLSPTPSNWPNYPDRPVEKVSWNDARIFFDRLTKLEQAAGRMEPDWEYVLPTDAEWEYACRAGTTTEYSWGNEISTAKANYNSSQTVNVGSYEANAWGFHDMHGNLYEWVWDWKSDAGSYGNFTDPQGAEKGLYKIKRGGSWLADASQLKSSAQSLQEAPQRGSFLGLRAALKYFPNRTPKELTSVAPLEILPNQPTGTQVGEFTAIDLDADPLTYQLVSGSGDTHNSQFTLLANGTLSTAQSLAFDNGLEAYSIRVRASDEDGEYVEAVFSITEIEVYEPEYPNHVVKSAADMEMIFVSPGTFAMGPTSWDGKRQVTITRDTSSENMKSPRHSTKR